MLPVVAFWLNNSIHASTDYTPFYMNGLTHPRVTLKLLLRGSGLVEEEIAGYLLMSALLHLRKRLNVSRHDSMAESQEIQ